MRRPARLIAAGWLVAIASQASAAMPTPEAPMPLGTTTHFGQGWPESRWALLARARPLMVRDGLRWPAIERTPGRFVFTAANSGHIKRLCAAGHKVLLGFGLSHPQYDGGKTVFTAGARTALADYVAAVAQRFGKCLAAVEIGNEINIKNNITGAAAIDRPAAYVAILRAVHARLKATAPDVAILGGSTNAIGTGFLIELADAGMLSVVDGIAVHPYRQDPANIDWELARLQAALAARGPRRPIWATEFSRDFARPSEAPDFLAKMATLMSSAGVAQAQWYALADQPGFPSMGLFTSAGAEKPAAAAFEYWNRALLAQGRARRQDPDGDPTLFHFRFGADHQVVWGSPRTLQFTGTPRFRDASGRGITAPARIGEAPLVIEGATTLRFGAPTIIADSLTGYGRAPWRYLGARGGTAPVTLEVTDWNWTSFIGHPTLKPAVINQHGLAAGGTSVAPIALTVRYVADRPGRVFALACLRRKGEKGDGVTLKIARNGDPVAAYPATAGLDRAEAMQLAAGDTVDFTVMPNRNPLGDQFGYRYQIATSAESRPSC